MAIEPERRTPHAGQVLVNPVSGERSTFIRIARDTTGELLEFELDLTPDGRVPGAHVHPAQEETFEILAGSRQLGRVIVVPLWTSDLRPRQ